MRDGRQGKAAGASGGLGGREMLALALVPSESPQRAARKPCSPARGWKAALGRSRAQGRDGRRRGEREEGADADTGGTPGPAAPAGCCFLQLGPHARRTPRHKGGLRRRPCGARHGPGARPRGRGSSRDEVEGRRGQRAQRAPPGQHWTRLQASAQHAKNLFSEEAHR